MYLVDVHEIPLSVADRAQSSGKLFQDFLFHTPNVNVNYDRRQI